MDKRLVTIMAVLAVAAGLAVSGSTGYAATTEEDGKGSWKAKQEEFFKDLSLTPEQIEKVKAKHETQKGLHKEAREQMKAKMEALHAELNKPVVDRAVVDGLVADINTLKGQEFTSRIDGVLELKEILTPEQFSKFQAKHKERGPGKHGWGKNEPKEGPPEDGPDEN